MLTRLASLGDINGYAHSDFITFAEAPIRQSGAMEASTFANASFFQSASGETQYLYPLLHLSARHMCSSVAKGLSMHHTAF